LLKYPGAKAPGFCFGGGYPMSDFVNRADNEGPALYKQGSSGKNCGKVA
jgi:hypothetical protein